MPFEVLHQLWGDRLGRVVSAPGDHVDEPGQESPCHWSAGTDMLEFAEQRLRLLLENMWFGNLLLTKGHNFVDFGLWHLHVHQYAVEEDPHP